MRHAIDGSNEQRLKRLERDLSQTRNLLLVVLAVLILGVFGPPAMFVLGVGGCIVYGSVLVFDVISKRKLESYKQAISLPEVEAFDSRRACEDDENM
ncbi:MAG: hypothetical protein K1Y02_05460 [Candidatus Hydrogenedentes bacterium]|nr:hypothetical protein [Candidatus Hydrogenedentota bacterium]